SQKKNRQNNNDREGASTCMTDFAAVTQRDADRVADHAEKPRQRSGRRDFLRSMGSAALLAGMAGKALAQPAAAPASTATERDWSGAKPQRYPDPDIIALDPRFRACIQFNAPLQRLYS